VNLLFRELLIGVTGFFRDPAAFEALRTTALPRLLDRRAPDSALRVWTAGCSTGEETYSVAMVLAECLEQAARAGDYTLQIFGTDLDREAVEKARQGLFPASAAADVPPERLKRFFSCTDDVYTVRKSLRERIVFAPQNVLTAELPTGA
jgi:two-component system, chemotaxis family, CheB/CheR fusion protein